LATVAGAVLEGLIFQRDVDRPHITMKWMPVQYEYDPQPRGGAAGFLRKYVEDLIDVKKIPIQSPHLGFFITWTNPSPSDSLQKRIDAFDMRQLEGDAGFLEVIFNVLGLKDKLGNSEAVKRLFTLFETLLKGSSAEEELAKFLATQLGITTQQLKSLFQNNNPVIVFPQDHRIVKNLEAVLRNLAVGNDRKAVVEKLEFNLGSYAITAKVNLHSRQVWNDPQEGLDEAVRILTDEIGAKVAEVARVLFNELGRNSSELADILWHKTSATIVEVATALRDVVGRDAVGVATDLLQGARVSITKAAEGIWGAGLVRNSGELADVLQNQTSAGLAEIAAALRAVVGPDAPQGFTDLVEAFTELVFGTGLPF
jgi:hypothetical protein